MAHALGTHAIIAGRELEGVGETLRDAGQIVDSNIDRLTLKIRDVLLDPSLVTQIENKAGEYARYYSWKNQIFRHYEMADAVVKQAAVRFEPDHLKSKDPLVALATGSPNSEIAPDPTAFRNLIHNMRNTEKSLDQYPAMIYGHRKFPRKTS
jgi:hypothetical protein